MVFLAGGGLVAIEHGEGQVFDVEADAIADDEQQQYGAEQRHAATDRVAAQLQRFAAGIAEQAAQAEALTLLWRRLFQRRRLADRLLASRLLQVSDEGGFQVVQAAFVHQALRRVAVQHAAGVHQRYAIAALRLVHEVGGDEDGHAVLARQVEHQLPETVTRHRVDA